MCKKRLINVMLICLFASVFAGCANNSDADARSELFANSTWYYDEFGDVVGNAGVFYLDSSGYLRFFDGESGADVSICDRANCQHDTEDCAAYFDASVLIPLPATDGLQLVTDMDASNLGELSLYECSLNGQNRKEIVRFSQQMQFISDAVWTDEYIVLAYHNMYDQDYNNLTQDQAGIFIYDRQNQRGSTVWSIEGHQVSVAGLELEADHLYFSFGYTDYDDEQFYKLFDEGDTETLIEGIHTEEYRLAINTGDCESIPVENVETVRLSDDAKGAYVIAKDQSIKYWSDISTSQDREEVELFQSGASFLKSDVAYTQFFSVYDGMAETYTYYKYDEETETLEQIGDMTSYIVSMIFSEKVYVWDCNTEDGSSVRGVLSYEDFCKGDFSNLIRSDYSDLD